MEPRPPSPRDDATPVAEYRHLGGGTLPGLLRDRARSIPDKVYLRTRERSLTYAEMDDAADRVAASLLALGLKPGDFVCVMVSNRPEYLSAWFGIARAGMVKVPVNVDYKGDFLRYVVEHSGAKALIVDDAFVPCLNDIADAVAALDYVISTSESAPDLGADAQRERLLGWSAFLARGSASAELPRVRSGDLSSIMYTSGTTGRSKGVMTTHVSNLIAAFEMEQSLRLISTDVLYTCLPLFHGNAQMSALSALCLGATVAVAPRFSSSRFWDDIRDFGATETNVIGSILFMLYASPPAERDRCHKLRLIFAAPAPPVILYRFEERFNTRIIEGYGQTEIKTVLYNPYDARRPGSVGKPTPTSILAILDDDDNELPADRAGEIAYRPKAPDLLCKGYLKDLAATNQAMRNLWWHTGDMGYRDADGYFYFIDRKKDALRRRGENISSFEVERILLADGAVLDAAAVAVRSEVGEDEVMAVVAPKAGRTVDPAALFRHCDGNMPYFMVPRYFRILADLPRTSNGKIQKAVLREAGVTPDTWDAAKEGHKPTRNPTRSPQ
jgi:crotonobetaine/carnitine-CoA ligase